MEYKSTRNSGLRVSAAQAITQGISAEGGLFVPESLPRLELEDLECLAGKSYNERAIEVLSLFLTDFSDEQLCHCVNLAYTEEKFGDEEITRLVQLGENGPAVLELWHGPTCAFKDMALQLLPHLLTTSARIIRSDSERVILVATSGDTGKAALEGFRDVPGTRMMVFYPAEGVSPTQKRQMVTQEGENVSVCAVEGNFDDAQTAVKSIFTDPVLRERMAEKGLQFSSANSINWGRLVPQIVYYVSAYCDLLADGKIKLGDPVNVCVPTGNFGNILAAYYAKKMGVPFGKLICASNKNRILTDFIRTGIYDCNRDFYATNSPSMDILVSSNLERLLYDLCGEEDLQVTSWYRDLKETGRFEIPLAVREKLTSEFWGGSCGEAETLSVIQRIFSEYSYLSDTHTAVALGVYENYREETGDQTLTLVVSTANPYKFTGSVLSSLGEPGTEDEAEQMALLHRISELEIPASLLEIQDKPVRFNRLISREEMKEEVGRMLGL